MLLRVLCTVQMDYYTCTLYLLCGLSGRQEHYRPSMLSGVQGKVQTAAKEQ